MHHLKHQLFKSSTFNNRHLYIAGLFVLMFIYSVECKTSNESTNSTNPNENFNYDPSSTSLQQLASNSITSLKLFKNTDNLGDKTSICRCPPKGLFSHSQLNAEEENVCMINLNSEIKYACKSGYTKASGSEKLSCVLINGKAEWNGKPLNCKAITCADPGDVAHANKIVKDPNFSFNSQVSYQCHTNYASDIKPVMLCDRNGQWNRKKPVCKKIQCPYLTQLDPNLFIRYTDPDRVVNSTVSFQCKQGFHLDDENSVRQCEWNGNWTGANPNCLLSVYCELSENMSPDLIVIPSKTRYEPGEKINFKCKSSKKYTTVQCQLTGEFNLALPVECPKVKKTHCLPVELQHGLVNSSAQDEFVIGAKLSFKCDENYILNEPNKEMHCLHNGEWSSGAPRCLDLATIRTSQILSYILTCIIIILVLIVTITVVLLFRWRQKQLQKRHWNRYFCNLEYQHCDKTKVQGNSSQEMHIFQAQRISVPFTDL